jgi:hypothetical protein
MNQPDNFKNATRCQHTKMNGQPCSAPARRARRFCIFHDAANRKPRDFAVPILEDATSLQFAILQVMRALADKAIEPKTAALMLYGLQIAASNLKRFAEEQSPAHSPDEEPSLLRSLLDQFQNPQYQEELERERDWEKLDDHHPQPDHQNYNSAAAHQPPFPGFPFEIKACAEPPDDPPDEPADCVARVFDPSTRVGDPRHTDRLYATPKNQPPVIESGTEPPCIHEVETYFAALRPCCSLSHCSSRAANLHRKRVSRSRSASSLP